MSRNNSLKYLFMLNGIFVFASSFLGPLYAVYTEKFEASVLTISLSWAVFLTSTFVFTLFVSKYGDQIKEKEYLLMAGFLLRAIAWIMFIFASNILIFMLIQIVLGLGEAVGSPAFDALFAEHIDEGEHISEYSDWKLVLHGAQAIGTVLGGIIVSFFGFNLLFLIMSLLAVVSSIGIFRLPRKVL